MDLYENFTNNTKYQGLISCTFLLMTSLPVGRYIRFSFCKKWSCPPFFAKTIKDRKLKLSGIIDF